MDQTRLYGTYTIIPCKKDAKPAEKMEVVKSGIKRLIKEVSTWDSIPDFNTMQFVVHEGITHSKNGLNFYCKEQGEQIDDAKEVLSVGIKFNATERRGAGMSDREKIIKGLECLAQKREPTANPCKDCGFSDRPNYAICVKDIASDALELLKEQEAEIEHLKRPDCEHAEHDGTGCLGYCGCTQDDEPIESCKRCEKYTGNI